MRRRMQRKLVRMIGVALMAVSLFAQAGAIQLKCEPGARIYLDSVFQGITTTEAGGMYLAGVAGGTHTIRATKDGRVSQLFEVEAHADRTVEATVPQFAAAPRRAKVDLQTTGFSVAVIEAKGGRPVPSATVVYIGPGAPDMPGGLADAGGWFEQVGLEPGSYGLLVVAIGYIPREGMSVTVVQGTISPVTVKLQVESGSLWYSYRWLLGGLVVLAVGFLVRRRSAQR